MYSLGATFYRILAGRSPFEGRDVASIVRKVARDEPTPITALAPGLPPHVAGLVRAMMRRDPGERLSSATEVLRRMSRLEKPVEARTDRREAFRRARQAERVRTRIVAALFLAALAAGAWFGRGRLAELWEQATGDSADPGSREPDDDTAAKAAPGPGPANPRAGPWQIAKEKFDELRKREEALAPPSEANAEEWRALASDYARIAKVFDPRVRAVGARPLAGQGDSGSPRGHGTDGGAGARLGRRLDRTRARRQRDGRRDDARRWIGRRSGRRRRGSLRHRPCR